MLEKKADLVKKKNQKWGFFPSVYSIAFLCFIIKLADSTVQGSLQHFLSASRLPMCSYFSRPLGKDVYIICPK